ncbi:MAG: hypothetical protein O3A51_08350 [Verrucomicrobia bacterium]|nr:hypothetical protein [Verrucomicrobiota bacterium]
MIRSLLPSAVISLLLTAGALANDPSVQADEQLDTQLGIINEPFVINLSGLRTRTDLRTAAGVETGLPSYDQQVATAQQAPTALFTELTMPAPLPTPKKKSPSSKKKEPDCYLGPNNNLICN